MSGSNDRGTLVLFLMPAAVGGARAEAVPVDVGALGTNVAACDDEPPLTMLLLCLGRSCSWSTASDAVVQSLAQKLNVKEA